MPRLKLILVVCFLISAFSGFAQVNAKIVVVDYPPLSASEKIFVAGNFNGWDPAKTPMEFNSESKSWSAIINLSKPELLSFKFTKGSWETVQSSDKGNDVANNEILLNKDSTWKFDIKGWKNNFSTSSAKVHTASQQVQILDSAFAIPQLATHRRIWIYLPKDYTKSKKSYPVLYMHDGQNLFDEFTSGFGEWGVDECLDSLIEDGLPASIVVGIDNGPERLQEYNPYDHEKYGKAKGDEYVKFIVETLKPYIDKHFRTLKERDFTSIAGSSMGGLISCYAFLQYPQTFGKAGIFSPAFWTAPGINSLAEVNRNSLTGKLFFYAGELEDDSMVPNMLKIADEIGENTATVSCVIIDPSGKHSENTWRTWFPQFYKWMVRDGNNVIIKP